MSLNVKTTECIVVSKKSLHPNCNLISKGEQIKQITKFKYLGYKITSDGNCTNEIRIAMTKDTFQKMKSVFTKRDITMNTKIGVLKAHVWSVLLYGCACCTINKEMERKLAVEIWFIRRMMRISWTEQKSNEAILKDADLERSLMKAIRKRQLTF